eukprot:4987889-Pleurochrysis_carterae.AAC.1
MGLRPLRADGDAMLWSACLACAPARRRAFGSRGVAERESECMRQRISGGGGGCGWIGEPHSRLDGVGEQMLFERLSQRLAAVTVYTSLLCETPFT